MEFISSPGFLHHCEQNQAEVAWRGPRIPIFQSVLLGHLKGEALKSWQIHKPRPVRQSCGQNPVFPSHVGGFAFLSSRKERMRSKKLHEKIPESFYTPAPGHGADLSVLSSRTFHGSDFLHAQSSLAGFYILFSMFICGNHFPTDFPPFFCSPSLPPFGFFLLD